jgi:hypothetical protein
MQHRYNFPAWSNAEFVKEFVVHDCINLLRHEINTLPFLQISVILVFIQNKEQCLLCATLRNNVPLTKRPGLDTNEAEKTLKRNAVCFCFINFHATSCSQISLSNAAAFVGIFPVLLLRDVVISRLLV